MKVNNAVELSSLVKSQRKKVKRSQRDVALKVGILPQTISGFEKHSHNSKIDTLLKIIHELDMELHLVEKDQMPAEVEQWTEEW